MKASFRIEAPRYGGELLDVSSSEALGQGVELRSTTASNRASGAHGSQPARPGFGAQELHGVKASFWSSGPPTRLAGLWSSGAPRYGCELKRS